MNDNTKMPQLEFPTPPSVHEGAESLSANATVPVGYIFESGERASGDFAFVGKVWGYDEVKKARVF